MPRDLFGHEVKLPSSDDPALTPRQRAKLLRKPTQPNGYAWKPGTGPQNETCGSCRHIVHQTWTARGYLKCALVRQKWTRGPGTDIRARSPACKLWEKPDGSKMPGNS